MVLEDDRYAFLVEWRDAQSDTVWRYQLLYYRDSHQIEMHDLKSRRVFLKRSKFENLVPERLPLGVRLNVLSRQLQVVDYGDKRTRDALSPHHEKTFLIFSDSDLQSLGAALKLLGDYELYISGVKLVVYSEELARKVADLDSSFGEVCAGRCVSLEIIGRDATERAQLLKAELARNANTGVSMTVSVPSTREAADKLGEMLAEQPATGLERGDGSTLAVIKPHALLDGTAGKLLDSISRSFTLLNVRSLTLDTSAATQFCEIYRDAVTQSEFCEMVEALSSGLCIAVQLLSHDDNSNTLESLRALCGPADPDLCRCVRPDSLRALYGFTKALNAIHCTDLTENVNYELQFMFNRHSRE